jgi:arabinofuranan 3-O-arabinosyltransferase
LTARRQNLVRAFAIGIALALAAKMLPMWLSMIDRRLNPDFDVYYTAAKLLSLDPGSLYNLERQLETQRTFAPAKYLNAYFYPPFFAVALRPLASLSFVNAFVVMTLLNSLLLLLSLRVLVRSLALDKRQAAWLVLIAACNFGIYNAWVEGQGSFIALMLTVLYVVAFNDPDRRPRAGIWAALICFKPPLAIVPVLVLIVRWEWRALANFAIVLAGLAAVSIFAIGWHGIADYLVISQRVAAEPRFLNVDYAWMNNIRAITYYYLGFSSSQANVAWILLTTLTAMAVIWYAQERYSRLAEAWTVILICQLLIAPYLFDYDTALLLIPAAFLLKSHSDEIPASMIIAMIGVGLLPLAKIAFGPPLFPLALLAFVIYATGKRIFEREQMAATHIL